MGRTPRRPAGLRRRSPRRARLYLRDDPRDILDRGLRPFLSDCVRLLSHLRRSWSRSARSANTEGFRTPALCRRAGLGAGPGSESLVRGKPRGRIDAVWLGATYGDLKVADGSPLWRRGRKAAGVVVESEHDGPFRGRGCERRVWARQLERVCGGREDIASLLRRAAGGEEKRRCGAGSATAVMRCRS